MPPTLRIVLDQLVTTTDPQLALVQRELSRALVDVAPRGCLVSAIAPAGPGDPSDAVPGLESVHRLGLQRRELAAAWQLGVGAGAGGGMIHAATLLAPLVRHDRVHDNDQTVVTLWDLDAWEAPTGLARSVVRGRRSQLKRAERHADAIVVPTHAMAARLAELAKVEHRIRVIEGAAPAGFTAPADAVGRRRTLGVPEDSIVVVGPTGLDTAFRAIAASGLEAPVVVLDAGGPAVPAPTSAHRVVVLGDIEDADRAAVLAGALAVIAPSPTLSFPWRVVEALAVGAPVVAAASDVHREIIVDGGWLAEGEAGLAEGLVAVAGTGERYRVLAGDRGRAFSWRHAAERVWQLHAEL